MDCLNTQIFKCHLLERSPRCRVVGYLVLLVDERVPVPVSQQVLHVEREAAVLHLCVPTQDVLQQGVVDEDVLVLHSRQYLDYESILLCKFKIIS